MEGRFSVGTEPQAPKSMRMMRLFSWTMTLAGCGSAWNMTLIRLPHMLIHRSRRATTLGIDLQPQTTAGSTAEWEEGIWIELGADEAPGMEAFRLRPAVRTAVGQMHARPDEAADRHLILPSAVRLRRAPAGAGIGCFYRVPHRRAALDSRRGPRPLPALPVPPAGKKDPRPAAGAGGDRGPLFPVSVGVHLPESGEAPTDMNRELGRAAT